MFDQLGTEKDNIDYENIDKFSKDYLLNKNNINNTGRGSEENLMYDSKDNISDNSNSRQIASHNDLNRYDTQSPEYIPNKNMSKTIGDRNRRFDEIVSTDKNEIIIDKNFHNENFTIENEIDNKLMKFKIDDEEDDMIAKEIINFNMNIDDDEIDAKEI